MQKEYIKNEYAKMWTQMREKEYKYSDYDKFLINLVEEEIKNNNKKKILEVCCGDGNPFAKKLIQKSDYFGIDISEHLINIAKKSYGEKYFKIDDAEKIQLNSSFDIIICFHSLWYLPNYLQSLREMKRLLKPNGYLIFDALNLKNLENIKEFKKLIFESKGFGKFTRYIKNFIKILSGRGYAKWSDAIHHQPNDIEKIIKIIEEANSSQITQLYGLNTKKNNISILQDSEAEKINSFSKIIFKCKKIND